MWYNGLHNSAPTHVHENPKIVFRRLGALLVVRTGLRSCADSLFDGLKMRGGPGDMRGIWFCREPELGQLILTSNFPDYLSSLLIVFWEGRGLLAVCAFSASHLAGSMCFPTAVPISLV